MTVKMMEVSKLLEMMKQTPELRAGGLNPLLLESIRKNGFIIQVDNYIVVTDKLVLSGRQRIMAAAELNMGWIPVKVLDVNELEAAHRQAVYNLTGGKVPCYAQAMQGDQIKKTYIFYSEEARDVFFDGWDAGRESNYSLQRV